MTESRRDEILGEIRRELETAPPAERAELLALAERLAERPVPRPQLRSTIRGQLTQAAAARPPRARQLALAYLACGSALLLFAGVGVAGLGPLAA